MRDKSFFFDDASVMARIIVAPDRPRGARVAWVGYCTVFVSLLSSSLVDLVEWQFHAACIIFGDV